MKTEMKIEIKNVKHSEFASHETDCFEATVYFNGKRSFIASNDGQGGCNRYYPIKGGDQVAVYKQVEKLNKELVKEIIYTEHGTLTNDLDLVIGEMLVTWQLKKRAKSLLRKVCVIAGGRLMSFNISAQAYQRDPSAVSRAIFKKYPDADILNRFVFDIAFEKMDGHI